MEWLPFSVDTNVFKSTDQNRINKICFSGSMTGPYPDRIFATGKLKPLGLIDVFSNKEKIGNNYVECLRQYVSHLSGASSVDITAAKNFEIMSSGSVLFTNNFTGLKDLFPDNLYVEWNEDNIVDKANYIINNPQEMKIKARDGMLYIREHHTHEKRIEQMLEIIKKDS